MQTIADVVFPITCVGCGRVTHTEGTPSLPDKWLCRTCQEQIIPDRPLCIVCRTPAPSGRTCYPCLPRTPISGTLAVGPYRDPILQSAVKRLKFHGVRALANPLGNLLARRIIARGAAVSDALQGPTVLVPLPLHPRRERQRGYNQAALLADVVAQHVALPVRHALRRTKSSAPQTSILGSGHVRKQNVSDAFELNTDTPLPRNARVLLIDDVLTTGATLHAAAQTLCTATPRELWAVVVARG